MKKVVKHFENAKFVVTHVDKRIYNIDWNNDKKIKDIREYSIEKIIDPITLELRVSIEDFRRWLGVDEKKIWLHTGGK